MTNSKADLIEARMVNLAKFAHNLEIYGPISKPKEGVWRLPVKRTSSNGDWLGTLELVEDSSGNPASIHLNLSLG